jgi:hypothetical protein
MKTIAATAAMVLALATGTATAAPLALPWGGFEPPGGNEGDLFGVPCRTERGLRNVLADEGYTHVLLGVINDDYHRVTAKADQGGVTYRIVLNSCTGKLIARDPA